MDTQSDCGVLLRHWRITAGLTQEELAERAGLSVRTIRALERGATTRPYRHSTDRLADALGLADADRQAFTRAARRAPGTAWQPPGRPVPRQLPPPVPGFTGRTAELRALAGLLDTDGMSPGTVVISAADGMAGVGRTALAVHWAHQIADGFPDGQLYVNLRGGTAGQAAATPPEEALATFLRAMGVAAGDIPADGQERAARYRSMLAGRQVLVLLGNAGSAEQVRPLLPGSPACVVVVTSRDVLSGLVARDGARRLVLGPMSAADSGALLTRLIGDRAAADPAATAALAARCDRLPLALRVAAGLALAHPDAPLADLANELADELADDLTSQHEPGAAAAAVFAAALRRLDPAIARTFLLLCRYPGPGIGIPALAALTGATVRQAGRAVKLLERAQLIQMTGPDGIAVHDLLSDYARERHSLGEPGAVSPATGQPELAHTGGLAMPGRE
ncbi:MAG TPA: helix-turn-helix transcriptional regulator [Streptosporangiaceae bacterium]